MSFGSDTGSAIDAEIARQVGLANDAANLAIANVQNALNTAQANAQATITTLTKQRDDALAEVERLSHPAPVTNPVPTPAPTPTPAPAPVTRTLFGFSGSNADRTKSPGKVDAQYFDLSQAASAIALVKKNHAAGLLTWLSFKVKNSAGANDWAGAVKGTYDAQVQKLLGDLHALGIEVWVTFHHEPENDGDITLWTKMQDRFSRLVPMGVSGTVKYWIVLTGWHQEFGTNAAFKVDALWPKGAPVYGLAYDYPYCPYGKVYDKNKVVTDFNNSKTEGTIYIDRLAVQAKKLGVRAGVRESAYSDEMFAADPAWLDRVFAKVKSYGSLFAGFCYYDSMANSSHTWLLGAATSHKAKYVNALIAGLNK